MAVASHKSGVSLEFCAGANVWLGCCRCNWLLTAQTRHSRQAQHRPCCKCKALPRSGPSDRSDDHGDAALGTDVIGAQIATFAKSRDLTAKWRSYAVSALERADLRCHCRHRSSSKGRDAGHIEPSLQLREHRLSAYCGQGMLYCR